MKVNPRCRCLERGVCKDLINHGREILRSERIVWKQTFSTGRSRTDKETEERQCYERWTAEESCWGYEDV